MAVSGVIYPKRPEAGVLEVGMMREAWARTMAVHPSSGMVVWSGLSRVGKTTTAQWLESLVTGGFTTVNPDAFRALYYQSAGGSGRSDKRAMRSIYTATIGDLDEGEYRSMTPQRLARLTASGLIQNRSELLLVDEAGLLDPTDLRALVSVRDAVIQEGCQLTVVLIGMDDLPVKIRALPQVNGRVQEWISFGPYGLKDTAALMAFLCARFQGVEPGDEEWAEVEYVHEKSRGLAGDIVSLLHRAEGVAKGRGEPLGLAALKVAYMLPERDRMSILGSMHAGYQPPRSPG